MKCYSLIDENEDTLTNYFSTCYKFNNNYEIISSHIVKPNYNTVLNQRHQIINSLTKPTNKYLEIGIEFGYTFFNTHFVDKIGVDPDPKCDSNSNTIIIKTTSDMFFETLDTNKKFDVIFIDGMHHCENILRDFNNSIRFLNEKGIILIDDILPINYNEQLKIPIKHYYENGILKYGEEWTGDVWKFVYHLLKNYQDKIRIAYFYNVNYRGIIQIQPLDQFEVIVNNDELNNYDYFNNFNEYIQLLSEN
jgi:SAM-dependent methyltransferase